ncbi:MAG: hypothetical protein KGH89_04450 [Thaumarchaeota archaeon]|nr:hypothetical protein [Nitrososphaerota archaeon]MDE1866793.1 hypothetical protein [Nitrososphaerota archaeon]
MTSRLLVTSVITSLLLFGAVSPSFATVNFSATLPLAGNPINPTYDFEKSFYIDYPAGSKLQSILQGKNATVVFTDNATSDPALKTFMQQINTDIVSNEHSTAVLTNLVVDYQLAINGYSDHASFDYKIVLTPTVTGYVLNTASGDIPETFDASWMAFNASAPVSINTNQYGPIEINYPIDAIKSQMPDLYNALKGTDAYSVFQNPNLLDATGLFSQQPVDKWDSLFDPAYTLTETAGYGYQGQKIAVTTFSSGLSNAFSGTLHVNNIDEDFTGSDGLKYHISTKEQANAGTINIEGHANPNKVQGGWTFTTTAQASNTTSTVTAGGTSTMMVYGMAGFAGVIAVGIFWWSNKKMKEVVREVDTGPVHYEERHHWADKFDGTPGSAASTSSPSNPDDKPKRSAI